MNFYKKGNQILMQQVEPIVSSINMGHVAIWDLYRLILLG